MKRILIIDEDPGVCYSMYLFLQNKYDVVTCTSVEEGIESIKCGKADLLITEAHTSRDGASRVIRAARELAPDLPIVLMSVCEDEMQGIERDIGAKLDAHILKPFENDEVVNMLESILEKRGKAQNESAAVSM